MSEQIIAERWIFRIGSGAAIIGSLLAGVGNLLHPVTPIQNPEGVALVIAESILWVPVHVVIVLGIIIMLGGLVALYHSIKGGLAGALARFGLFAALAGTTLGVILVTLDGIAAKQLAEEWARAPQRSEGALRLVLAEQTLDFALASFFNILYAGITFILYGLAVALSRVYPRWLGWVAVVAGMGSIGAGLVQAYTLESTPLSKILTIIFPTIIVLWLLVMGILLARKATGLGRTANVKASI